ncbi:MAG: hypothetical protein QOE27_286 [Solirubrobacteraceae bacterium]|nr:hypothetical protein [Solirubrobacteraceae bacterium]MEA2302523.1 hypothetical protein [Solirubrobacteraceae bacterium]
MLTDELERKGLLAIAVVTVATGATQVLVPGAMLGPLRAQDTPATRHLFGTVGMFMVIVGGLLFGALRRPGEARRVVFWASAQKLGASGAVALGVRRSVFAWPALLVAAFDFASGVLALDYWRRLGGR